MNKLFKLIDKQKGKTYCVYCHKNKINSKCYIGQTKYQDNPHLRWKNGTHYKGNFKKAIDKYGWNNFEHIILINNLTKEDADYYESYYIDEYKSNNDKFGYNITNGGTKYTYSTENKEKIYGKPYIENKEYKYSETRRKKIGIAISKAQIGCVWLHKDTKNIFVKYEDIDTYLNQGYVKGRYYNKVWVNKDTRTKMIDKSELQNYLDNGWLFGRSKKGVVVNGEN